MNKKFVLDNQNLNEVKKKIDKADNVMLFLDYDGTLAPFRIDPLSAFALPEAEASLKKLAKKNLFESGFR